NKDIIVHPLVSPNGDGIGDYFHIENIISFPDNEVVIFNRWGNEVFRMKGYNDFEGKVFNGYANTGLLLNQNENLTDGVYYYLIYTKQEVNGQKETRLNK